MGKIIAMAQHKGGVGKTSDSINIAAVLAKKGKKVLLVDNDMQASLTVGVGIDPREDHLTVADLYQGKPAKDIIMHTDYENYDVLPASMRLAITEAEFLKDRYDVLKNALSKIKKDYDYVIIDCPPNLGSLTINALMASDYVLIPCIPSTLATYALDDLFSTIAAVKKKNKNLKTLGIIASMYRKSEKLQREKLEEMQAEYDVIGVIKYAAAVARAADEGRPLVMFDNRSEVSNQFTECGEKILSILEG